MGMCMWMSVGMIVIRVSKLWAWCV